MATLQLFFEAVLLSMLGLSLILNALRTIGRSVSISWRGRQNGGQRISIRFKLSKLVWWTFKRTCELYLFLFCLMVFSKRCQGIEIRGGQSRGSMGAVEVEYELGKIVVPVPRMQLV